MADRGRGPGEDRDGRDADGGIEDAGDRVGLDPGHRLEGDVGGDRHEREEDERHEGEHDAGAGEPGRPEAAIEGDPGQQDADRGDGRTRRLEEGQRLAPEDHRQDDGQAAERRDHPADDRDRTHLQPGEVGQIGARPDDPEQGCEDERSRLARQARPGDHEDGQEQDRRDELHGRRHPEAADDAAAEGGDQVERAPRERGAEPGEQSEGHARSLVARPTARAEVAPVRTMGAGRGPCYHSGRSPVRGRGATDRGDVAQLEEHCVRIAGVRGSSPLISTTTRLDAITTLRRRARRGAPSNGRAATGATPCDRAGVRRPGPRTWGRGRRRAGGPARG